MLEFFHGALRCGARPLKAHRGDLWVVVFALVVFNEGISKPSQGAMAPLEL